MLRLENLSFSYIVVFLCLHPKGPQISYGTAAKYMKILRHLSVSKPLLRREEVHDLSSLLLRGVQTLLCKKSVIVSCDTITRRLLAHDVKLRSTRKKTGPARKKCKKKNLLGQTTI